MINDFCRYIKTFLVIRVRKYITKKLVFIKLAFGKSDFLDLIKSDIMDLAKFVIIDRFSILLSIIPLLSLVLASGVSWFSSFSLA